ncbi:MAG: hypothetical protein AEth_00919 [Candidatus Argoarchaeum ethanivorans]|uniref:Uncharacterized protein n=1 Tax=Candidatus Argoarchaeum ethanivorans TaxID=2608793 RepID=A0A8B3S378_9EURY|nr:MAG: hypothetical protein AEth_00919 [Candidatus Argoarchaeum ethanivorans]
MIKRIIGRSILTTREIITPRGILRQAKWRKEIQDISRNTRLSNKKNGIPDIKT